MFLDIPTEEITLPIVKSLVSSVCTVDSYWLLEWIDDIADRIDSNSELLQQSKICCRVTYAHEFYDSDLKNAI